MTRVLLVDDHVIFREGLKRILDDTPDMKVVGGVGKGSDLLAQYDRVECDVIVLDIAMPGESGVEILKQIRKFDPDQKVLVLSMHPEEQYAHRVLRAGASGYITKESSPEEVIFAIRKVAGGGRYVSTKLGEELAFRAGMGFNTPRHDHLSDREYQIMLMIASGKTRADIAKELSLSPKTISTYRARVMEKMSLRTDADLTNYVSQHQLL